MTFFDAIMPSPDEQVMKESPEDARGLRMICSSRHEGDDMARYTGNIPVVIDAAAVWCREVR
ncbi:hypothetical protein [Streptomyces sp. NPDC001268]|uniref:hypothetical protein n=1 Tax=Streptomyces sp. NPDC001268 TaxID=3364553 RepID=UPI0036C8DC96